VVERVFRNNNGKVEDAIDCLRALTSVDIHGRYESQSTNSAEIGDCGQNQVSCEFCASVLLDQFSFHILSLENVCVLGTNFFAFFK